MSNLLDELVRAQKRGEPRGIPSICSTHPWVLKAALQRGGPVLIESTCNQVNQLGGYSGMTPGGFVCFVEGIASQEGLPKGELLLGGDHLGPSPWLGETAEHAMAKAAELIRSYVKAGFVKLHLDASQPLLGDPPGPLAPGLSARRTAELVRVAEASLPNPAAAPRYVIGTEVPLPGGARGHEHTVQATTVQHASQTIELTRDAFMELGLESAWERVIALVVQPGLEFGDDFILDYNPVAALDLARFSEALPFVYEAHSTDYQNRANLRHLVHDHFAILKVGPALTFAFREAVFALAAMEAELIPSGKRSNIIERLEEVMLAQPDHWQKYYRGDETTQRLARKFSLSDRLRYYWGTPQVRFELERLLQNLGGENLPLTLVSQFAPGQLEKIRSGQIPNTPQAIILDKVGTVLDDYTFACG
jgi:D-tagatose-1,6-bisphosphate aldolase subunit GatZ/KbaZ